MKLFGYDGDRETSVVTRLKIAEILLNGVVPEATEIVSTMSLR